MSNKIGRNDKCHCGSGKKYKHCHLSLDELRPKAPAIPSTNPTAGLPHLKDPGDLREITDVIRTLAASAPEGKRAEFEKMLADAAPIVEFMERKERVEAASTNLEAYREEFRQLTNDKKAYLSRVRTLFGEETFVPLRFTAAEIKKAFDSVGFVPSAVMNDMAAEKLRAAILHLADSERRRLLSLGLLTHLPDYVTAGRHMDGWLIQSLANDTMECQTESNPFLFHMFAFGYDALMEEMRSSEEAILREIGLDPTAMKDLDMEQMEAWIKAHGSDPAIEARMEAVLKAHPEVHAQSAAQLEQLERASISLLEREDTREFLLPEEVVHQWLPLMMERWKSNMKAEFKDKDGALSKEEVSSVFGNAVFPMLREMAQSIYTPDRISDLLSKVRAFRNERFAAGDKVSVGRAFGAITSLERETEPGLNSFLVSLCFVSLRKLIAKIVQEHPDPEQNALAPEESR